MSSNYSNKKASLGTIAQFADKREDPREAASRIETPSKQEPGAESMLAEVAAAAADEMAPEVEGQPLEYSMDPRTDSRGKSYKRDADYDWSRTEEVGPNRRHGETLIAQERRLAEEAEMDRYRERARADEAAGFERGRSNRAVVEARDTEYKRTTSDEEADTVGQDPEADDPRAGMEAEVLAKVNQSAADLAERYGEELAMGRPEMARMLAKAVEGGEHLSEAVVKARRRLDKLTGVRQPVGDINPFQWRATIEGEVVSLFENPAANQYQAGYVEGDDGETVKVTYWQKSKKSNGKPTLAVGDRVRLEEAVVSRYQGQATLAITGDTEVTRLERCEGPKHRTGTRTEGARVAPWDQESRQHAWANEQEGGLSAADTEGVDEVADRGWVESSERLGEKGDKVECPVDGCTEYGTVEEVSGHMGGMAAKGCTEQASSSLQE